jgi:hypothetical protein
MVEINYNPAIPFSAFGYARQVIKKMATDQDPDEHLKIQLNGFDDFQSQAIGQLIINAYALSTAGIAGIADKEHGEVGDQKQVTFKIPGIGDAGLVRAGNNTLIVLPTVKGKAAASQKMAGIIEFFDQMFLKNDFPVVEIEQPLQGKYMVFSFPNKAQGELGKEVLASLIHAQGHIHEDDLRTIMEGFQLGDSPPHSAVLVREEVIKDVRRKESAGRGHGPSGSN